MKIAIIGRSGSGKSSVISELEKRGRRVVPEISRAIWDIIGPFDDIPQDLRYDAQQSIINIRWQLERLLRDTPHTVFFDRGIHDFIVYCSEYEGDDSYLKYYTQKYDLVIELPSRDYIKQTSRVEKDTQEAERIHQKILRFYKDTGHLVITIPEGTVEEQATYIDYLVKKDE